MRLGVAVVVAGLLIGGVSWGNALQQQFAVELMARASSRLVIPPQLLLYLNGKGADRSILQALRREQEQLLLARSFGNPGLFSRDLRELLQQALLQAQNEQLADFNTMLQQNVWEPQSVFSFTHELGSDVKFFLDLQYGTHTLVSNTRYGSVSGFSVIDSQQRRVFDFSSSAATDIEEDFFVLQSLPTPVFTPRHYVFHGEQYVYVLNRDTLALEYVGHSDTKIDNELSWANQVHKIARVNDSLLSVRYRNTDNREFVQLIDLNDLSTANAREIRGELLAIAPQGKYLAVQNNHDLEVIDFDSGSKHVFFARAATDVSFSADGKRLAYIDNNTLHLADLDTHTLPMPSTQQITLTPEQTLVSAETPTNELLWDGDDLYVMYRDVLFRVNSTGEILWRQELPADLHSLQPIDAQHLALFSEQGMLLYSREDGSQVLQLAVDKKQRIADQTFADHYLSLLLEDRLHFSAFGLTLARIPLTQLLQLLETSPLLRQIAATENFTLKRGHFRFAELVLSAVEQYLQHNQIPIAQLVQLLRELYQAYHLVSGSYYLFPTIANLLTQHADEVTQLTTDNPALAKLLRTSFL